MKVVQYSHLFSLLFSSMMMKFISAQPYDMILKKTVDHSFVAVDFTYIDDSKWYTITTAANQFVKDTILLVTIPQITSNIPGVVKMSQQTTLNADKTVTFSIRIVQPNDSYCSNKSYGYIPKYLPPMQVAWMVMEVGSYTINGYQFIAGKGSINRVSWSTSATFTNGNLVAVYFPTGCVSSTDYCVLSASDRGAINLLQTNINTKDAGKVLYLSVRAKIIDQRRGQWVLVPHDVAPGVTSYHILSDEILGYLAFQVGVKIECIEKMVWETAKNTAVNYVPVTVSYQNTYDYPPGIFGIVGTITALCDTILKSYNWTSTKSTIAINEDQCAKKEIKHTTPETVYFVVVGEKQSSTSNYTCKVNFNTALDPSPAPTRYPTKSPTLSPTSLPTFIPTAKPTTIPSRAPTLNPTRAPTANPTVNPTTSPTLVPTGATASPTVNPTRAPTANPTIAPTSNPTVNPTSAPTFTPTVNPTRAPTFNPTFAPTFNPTVNPTSAPTFNPTVNPTRSPTFNPTTAPTFNPSFNPTSAPSFTPTIAPTRAPTSTPTTAPTFAPSSSPTFKPSAAPSRSPTVGTTASPTNICSNTFPIHMYRV